MKIVLNKLKGGDFRSIGESDRIVNSVLANHKFFSDVFAGLMHPEPLVRMRAADVVEKISRVHPEWLQPFKRTLLQKIITIEQQEVRWHVAQIIPRLKLTSQERNKIMRIFSIWLDDEKESKIVRVMALQAIFDLTTSDRRLKAKILKRLGEFAESEIPSLRSRSRKLLKEFAGGVRFVKMTGAQIPIDGGNERVI